MKQLFLDLKVELYTLESFAQRYGIADSGAQDEIVKALERVGQDIHDIRNKIADLNAPQTLEGL